MESFAARIDGELTKIARLEGREAAQFFLSVADVYLDPTLREWEKASRLAFKYLQVKASRNASAPAQEAAAARFAYTAGSRPGQ
jgi:hypothetical protein